MARFFEENASKLPKLVSEEHSSDASPEAESASSETSSSLTGDVADFPPNLYAEWLEFFSGTLFNTVLQLFVCHAGNKRVYQHPRQPCFGNLKFVVSLFFLNFILLVTFTEYRIIDLQRYYGQPTSRMTDIPENEKFEFLFVMSDI